MKLKIIINSIINTVIFFGLSAFVIPTLFLIDDTVWLIIAWPVYLALMVSYYFVYLNDKKSIAEKLLDSVAPFSIALLISVIVSEILHPDEWVAMGATLWVYSLIAILYFLYIFFYQYSKNRAF